MTRSELATAADLLDRAAAAAESEDAASRLQAVADQLESLADADRDPDHGRLARIESKLHDVEADVGGPVVEIIDDAFAEIRSFRETLDGV